MVKARGFESVHRGLDVLLRVGMGPTLYENLGGCRATLIFLKKVKRGNLTLVKARPPWTRILD